MLQWVDRYNQGRETGNIVAFPATAYLLSWEWAQPSEEPFIDPRALCLLHGAVYVIAAMLAAGDGFLANARDRCSRPLSGARGNRILWLLGWIVIPAYAFYCVSTGAESTLKKGVWTPGFTSPTWWLVMLGQRSWVIWWAPALCAGRGNLYCSRRALRFSASKTRRRVRCVGDHLRALWRHLSDD